jgi:hypothetical protein
MIPIRSVALDSQSHKANTFTVQSVQPSGEKKLFALRASTHALMEEWLTVITTAGTETQKALEAQSSAHRGSSGGGGGGGTGGKRSSSSAPLADGKRNTDGSRAPASPHSEVSFASTPSAASSSGRRRGTTRHAPPLSHEEKAGGSANLYRLKFRFTGLLSHQNLLREPELGNVHFQYASTTVTLHDFVLAQRAPQLSALVESLRKKRRAQVVVPESKMQGVSLASLSLLAQHFYGDQLPLNEVSAVTVVDLAVAAKLFQLPSVQFHTQLHVRALLSMTNVYDVLLRAVYHKELGAEIKQVALDFAHSNYKLFVSDREKTKELGLELFHEVVALASQEYTPPPPPSNPPVSTLLQDFEAVCFYLSSYFPSTPLSVRCISCCVLRTYTKTGSAITNKHNMHTHTHTHPHTHTLTHNTHAHTHTSTLIHTLTQTHSPSLSLSLSLS